MTDTAERFPPRVPRARSRAAEVLRDVQFWIPVIVLLGALVVLAWIH